MSLVTRESVEKVRAASDLAEVVSGYTELRRQGARFTGLCPFHDERTPSFSVDPSAGLYYCFGCQAGGDVFTFLQDKENLEFRDVIEQLADRYGVELAFDASDPKSEQRRAERERLYELVAKAATFYERYLGEAEEAKRGRSYLEQRGLGEEILKEFGVGYAPSAWDRILKSALSQGYREPELQASGLAVRGKNGRIYDRFRGRIMFPLRDARGRTRGFGARAISDDQKPKYVNSPESDVYHKGGSLFGLDLARPHATKAGEVIVVEGYTDALALHQSGIRNVVAAMGTALTEEQVGELARLANVVILAFDADSSGQEAMLKPQKAAAERGVDLKVVRLPDDKDPCDLLQEAGPDDFAARVQEASSFLEFQVGSIIDAADTGSAAGKDRAVAQLAPLFATLPPSVERDEQTRRVADRLDLSEHLLTPLLSRSAPVQNQQQPARRKAAPVGKSDRWERIFLAMCISSGDDGRSYLEKLTDDHLSSDLLRRTRDWLVANFDAPTERLSHDDSELSRAVSEIVVRASTQPSDRHALEVGYLGLERRRIERELKVAGQANDFERQQILSKQRSETTEEIAKLMGGADASPLPRTGTHEQR